MENLQDKSSNYPQIESPTPRTAVRGPSCCWQTRDSGPGEWHGSARARAIRTMAKRITIRLNPLVGDLLDRRCQQTGQTVSQVVRGALELAIGPTASENPRGERSPSLPPPSPDYAFPQQLQELLPRYRAFGMTIYVERRRCFEGLLAICEVVQGHSQNAQDRALCAELLRIGRKFGLL